MTQNTEREKMTICTQQLLVQERRYVETFSQEYVIDNKTRSEI